MPRKVREEKMPIYRYLKYQFNDGGAKNQEPIGDCCVRAFAIALDLPYKGVARTINTTWEKMFREDETESISEMVDGDCFDPRHGVPHDVTLRIAKMFNLKHHEVAENKYMTATEAWKVFGDCILRIYYPEECFRRDIADSCHLVAIQNDTVQDTWDSRSGGRVTDVFTVQKEQ